MHGFIVYPGYVIENNEAIIELYGRLENDESFQIRISEKPYFYVKEKDAKKAKELVGFEIIATEMTNLDKDKVSKIIVNIPSQIKESREILEKNDIPCYEADIRFAYRFLMDKGIKGSLKITGEFSKGKNVDRVYTNPFIEPSDYIPNNLRIISFDIEAHHSKGDLYSISLYSDDYPKKISEAIFVGKAKNALSVKTQKEALEKFRERIIDLDPDVIIGWNVIDFDMDFLKKKFEEYKVPFNFSRNNQEIKLNIQSRFFRDSSATIIGRIILDGIHVLKGSFVKLPDYRLDTAAEHFLKERKEITLIKQAKYEEINRQYVEEPENLVTYNIKDSKLAYDILKKSGTFELTVQRSILTGMALDRVNASIASLDQVYIPEMNKRKIVANCTRFNRKDTGITGGFVMKSKPGIYDYVLVLDFKSLYPSIIKTFNIDPVSFIGNAKGEKSEVITAPNGASFRNDEGILPSIISTLLEERAKAKKAGNIYASNAIKILMNSFFGVLASPMCRFFSWEISNAITHFGQFLNKKTAEVIQDNGYEVIYGDSVGADSEIVIENRGKIEFKKISELYTKTEKRFGTKQYSFPTGLKSLTIDKKGNSVFSPIKYVMRHKVNKKMFRVHFTNNWHLDVTEDHSLIGYINKSKNNRLKTMDRLVEVKPTDIGIRIKSIISMKKIPYKVTSKKYSKEVYEFLGLFIGDGSFQRNNAHNKVDKDYYLGLSLGKDGKEVFSKVIKPLIKQGYVKNYWWSKTRSGDLKLNGLKLMKIVSENFRKNGKKAIPDWILTESEENICAFLRGLFTADGTVMIRNNAPIIKYTSVNNEYIDKVRKLLYLVGISNSGFKDNTINKFFNKNGKTYTSNTNSKNIVIKSKSVYMKKVGFLLKRKNDRAKIFTNPKQTRSINDYEFSLQSIKRIESINYEDYVYDLEIQDTHRFFANYSLVHNTDSIFVDADADNDLEAEKIGKKIAKLMNDFYEDYVVKEYSRKNSLELEFEKTFIRFWMPKVRGSDEGSKKRYAGLVHKNGIEEIDFTGLEFVRRDWTALAKKFQLELLMKVFKKEPVEDYVTKFVADVKSGKYDELLVYKKAIRKNMVEYTKTTPPHIKAARKLKNGIDDLQDNIIEYYLTTDGPEPVQNLIHSIDYDHYIDKQIKPLADAILDFYDSSFDDLIKGSKQTTLSGF